MQNRGGPHLAFGGSNLGTIAGIALIFHNTPFVLNYKPYFVLLG
jgi:hypothetical protein